MANAWIEAWDRVPVEPLPMPLQSSLVNPVIRAAGENPDVRIGAAGQIAGLIREVLRAAAVVRAMVAEAEAALGRVAGGVGAGR